MNESEIKKLLDALSAEDRVLTAPDYVEERLVAVFRGNRVSRMRRRLAIYGFAAAASVLVAVVLARRGSQQVMPTQLPVPNISNPAQAVAANLEIAGDASKKMPGKEAPKINVVKRANGSSGKAPGERLQPALRVENAVVAPVASPRSVPREVVTEFFPLMDPAPPLDGAAILRVRVPASAMQAVGLPVREDRLNDRVQADVVVGEEGLPRAIRFVTVQMR